jgi:hypothetical protein
MKILDFLFYYLVKWFKKRQQKFKRIDPIWNNRTNQPLFVGLKLTPHCKGKSIKYNAELNTGNIGYFEL